MHDYRTKRRYRQQKLAREGFYLRRRQRSRARRRAQQEKSAGNIPSMRKIFAPENLIGAYARLQQRAGHAPGPDGVTYNMLGRREVCQIMRELSQQLLSGSFDPSGARHVRIRKANGRGQRTLRLRSILHRVVAAALADALGPYFERMFLPGSHGFRHGLGTQTLLLELERIIAEQQRFVIAQDDIRNAFDNLAIGYVLKILQRHIHDEQLLVTVEKILRGPSAEQRTAGIDQGSPLSPLMLNVALHHGLDTPFSQTAAHPPWLRYADNLVYPARSVHEGTTAIQAAQQLLKPLGMSLKGEERPADLQKGQKAHILGFQLRWDNGRIQYDLAEEAWESLETALSAAHTQAGPDVALQAIRGWMSVWGPAFESKSEAQILNRIQEIAAEAGCRELSRNQLKRYLQSSRDRWVYRRQRAGHARMVPRGNREGGNEPAPLAPDRAGQLGMPEAESPQAVSAALSAPF